MCIASLCQGARVQQKVVLASQAIAVVELGELRTGLEHFIEVALPTADEAVPEQVGIKQCMDTV